MSVLEELDDDDFRQVMKQALWKQERWTLFMADDIIDRTDDAIRFLQAELRVQLTSEKATDEPEWAAYTEKLLTRLNARASVVRAAVKKMNREETANPEAYERKWSAFTFKLAESFEDSEASYLLDETFIPSGEITVREWMEARRSQADAKAARLVAVA